MNKFCTILTTILVLFLCTSMLNFPYNNEGKLKRVVIDAGHGGKDPGCLGKIISEKEVALNVAKKLGNYINQYLPDVEVIYTRDKDYFVELNQRAKIANDANADLFISIHANAQPKGGSVYGTETFVMGLHKTDANLEVAKRENSVIEFEDNYATQYDGFDPKDPSSYIALSLFQNANIELSSYFASKVENQFENRVGRHSRGVKQAGFLVLYKTTMPSVLIETGFLTNSKEERFLASDQGQDYMASAIFRAFRDYKQEVDAMATAY